MLSQLLERKYTHLFDIYDSDNNGWIEAADYMHHVKMVTEVRGIPADSPAYKQFEEDTMVRWEQLCGIADRDGDGRISRQEYLESAEVRYYMSKGEDLVAHCEVEYGSLFDLFDTDGNGYITVEEYRDITKIFGLEDVDHAAVFARLDLDGDGTISREEMMQLLADFFYRNDPDAPGNLLFGQF
ncbi:MAG: EF-hand domain-containing protein [Anaerolineae bacterium]|nr:EF-hand domain-containing protein [Anaerolineae bacterium]